MSEMYQVVSPAGVQMTQARNVSPSLPDLNGKVIGELWNWGFRGNETFPIIEDELRKYYPDIKFVDYREFGNFHDPNYEKERMKALPGQLKEYGVDAVIVGNGC